MRKLYRDCNARRRFASILTTGAISVGATRKPYDRGRRFLFQRSRHRPPANPATRPPLIWAVECKPARPNSRNRRLSPLRGGNQTVSPSGSGFVFESLVLASVCLACWGALPHSHVVKPQVSGGKDVAAWMAVFFVVAVSGYGASWPRFRRLRPQGVRASAEHRPADPPCP
jgi:hypothetical protein